MCHVKNEGVESIREGRDTRDPPDFYSGCDVGERRDQVLGQSGVPGVRRGRLRAGRGLALRRHPQRGRGPAALDHDDDVEEHRHHRLEQRRVDPLLERGRQRLGQQQRAGQPRDCQRTEPRLVDGERLRVHGRQRVARRQSRQHWHGNQLHAAGTRGRQDFRADEKQSPHHVRQLNRFCILYKQIRR